MTPRGRASAGWGVKWASGAVSRAALYSCWLCLSGCLILKTSPGAVPLGGSPPRPCSLSLASVCPLHRLHERGKAKSRQEGVMLSSISTGTHRWGQDCDPESQKRIGIALRRNWFMSYELWDWQGFISYLERIPSCHWESVCVAPAVKIKAEDLTHVNTLKRHIQYSGLHNSTAMTAIQAQEQRKAHQASLPGHHRSIILSVQYLVNFKIKLQSKQDQMFSRVACICS